MPDGSDDEEWVAPTGPAALPPDRPWVHPSELGAARTPPPGAAAPSATATRADVMSRRRVSWGTALVSASLGGLAVLVGLAATGMLMGFEDDQSVASGSPAAALAASITALAPPPGDALDSVVVLEVRGPRGVTQAAGIAVDERGAIVTTAASLEGQDSITLVGADARRHAAVVAATDPETDLALVRADGTVTRPRHSTAKPGVGAGVRLIAADPIDRDQLCTGEVQAVNETLTREPPNPAIHGELILSTSMALTHATVVTTSDGARLVGLVNRRGDRAGNQLVYAVPADVALRVGRQLATGTHRARSVDPGIIASDRREPATSDGLTVDAVADGGAAARAGIRSGDRIIVVDDQPVRSAGDLTGALAAIVPGHHAVVLIERDRVRRPVTLRFTSDDLRR